MDEALTPDDEEPPIFRLSETQSKDTITVCVEGDVDLSTVQTLRAALLNKDGAVDRLGAIPLLVLDFRDVSFIDSAGLALLVETRRKLGDEKELGLIVSKSSQPERVLQLGRFETFLKIGLSKDDLITA